MIRRAMVSRRRFRAAALAGLLAAATGASLLAGTGSAGAAALNPAAFRLQESGYSSVIAQLDAALPVESVTRVLDSANHAAVRTSVSASHFVHGFRWRADAEFDDFRTRSWYPQGVTTSSDAYGAGRYENRDVVLASWYDHADDGIQKGARISFVDWTNKSSPRYRHTLLVEPYTSGGQPTFRAVSIHAGGIFWYGYNLYVVDTYNGLRVFDLRHIYRVSTGRSNVVGRQSDGTYHAFNYRYVLPQSRRYTPISPTGDNRLRFSFVSLDRTTTPDSILVGEYDVNGAGPRIVRWDIDYTNRRLRTTNGVATARWAYQVNVASMQGVNSINGRFFISRSRGSSTRGDLLTWRPGSVATIHTGALPIGPEDLSYRENVNELWTLNEYPGNRYVFAVRPSSF